jgi:fructuronate reductase
MSMAAGLPADPRPDRPGVGIVHLGLGAFFRAHGAVYIAGAMQASGGDWGIVGVSLQSPAVRDALAPQGFAYHAVEQGPAGEVPRRIEVVQDVLVARENPQAVLDRMADPGVRIVSLTVTEKGYCHVPATGALNPDHPDIRHDLAEPLPVSAPGYLVRALQRRRAAGIAPFTVLSCDNLPSNGRVVRRVVLDLAQRTDPDLAAWIATEGRFPATMVDRIVPATRPDDIARLAAMGIADAAPVFHEPFGQWVVEDDFVGSARPDFAAAGVQMVADVEPWEHMKLRMLNGTHSALAYLGYLAGHETVADAARDPVFAAYLRRLWTQEIIPTLTPPPGADLDAYASALLNRYRNPALRHRTWQIAMDGSQKLPQRILGTLSDALASGRDAPGLMLAVAGWMVYVAGTDEAGRPIEVRDPLAADLARRAALGVPALLDLRAVFDADLARAIGPGIAAAHARLSEVGARRAVEDLA